MKESTNSTILSAPKREWESPRMEIQMFKPEEYCQICVQVACSYGWNNGGVSETPIPEGHHNDTNYFNLSGDNGNEWHRKLDNHTGCGWPDNHVFRINGDSYSLFEINIPDAEGHRIGESEAVITTQNLGTAFRDWQINGMQGVEIHWTTHTSQGQDFHHKGIVKGTGLWGNHS